MFGDKLALANATIGTLIGVLGTAGVELDAANMLSAEEITAKLGAAKKASIEAAVKLAIAPAVAEAITGPKASIAAFEAGLNASGITGLEFVAEDFTAPKAEGALNGAATKIKTAIETRVAKVSARQIAASGHPGSVDVPAGETDDSKAREVTPATKAEFVTTLNGITDPSERTTYFRAHSKKFIK